MAADVAERHPRQGGTGAMNSPLAKSATGLPSQAAFFDDDRPQYHIQPPAGWMNDPNGPIFYKGT